MCGKLSHSVSSSGRPQISNTSEPWKQSSLTRLQTMTKRVISNHEQLMKRKQKQDEEKGFCKARLDVRLQKRKSMGGPLVPAPKQIKREALLAKKIPGKQNQDVNKENQSQNERYRNIAQVSQNLSRGPRWSNLGVRCDFCTLCLVESNSHNDKAIGWVYCTTGNGCKCRSKCIEWRSARWVICWILKVEQSTWFPWQQRSRRCDSLCQPCLGCNVYWINQCFGCPYYNTTFESCYNFFLDRYI